MRRNDRRIRFAVLIAVLLLLTSVSFRDSAWAASKDDTSSKPYVLLSIYAHGDALISGEDLGHSFLTIKNLQSESISFCGYPIEPGRTISVSIFGDRMGLGGVYINREMVGYKSNVGCDCAWLSLEISESTYRKIEEATPGESYYHDANTGELKDIPDLHDNFWHNCTTYSVMMWNLAVNSEAAADPTDYSAIPSPVQPQPPQPEAAATPKPGADDSPLPSKGDLSTPHNPMLDLLISDGAFGVDAPKWVREEILVTDGHQAGAFHHSEPWELEDVFYLASDGSLVPDYPPIPAVTVDAITGDTLSFSWTVSGTDRPEMRRCDYSYDVLCLSWCLDSHVESYYNQLEDKDELIEFVSDSRIWFLTIRDEIHIDEIDGMQGMSFICRDLTDDRYIFVVRTTCASRDHEHIIHGNWSNITDVSLPKITDNTVLSENELRSVAEGKGRIGLWGYADYDADGTHEAFVITVDDNDEIQAVWFISGAGEATCMANDILGACYAVYQENPQPVLDCGSQKVFWADFGAFGSGWQTLLFSVHGGIPYELTLSREIQGIYTYGSTFSTTENDFSTGVHQYLDIPLIFNADTGEFSR